MSLRDVVHATGQRPHRRQRRQAEKRRKRRRRRTVLILLVSLVVVGGAVGGAWLGLKPVLASLTAPKDWTGTGTGSVEVQIPVGATGAQIGTVLAQDGVIKTARAFTDLAGRDPRAQQIQPGTYRLRLHMSALAALDLMLSPSARLTVKVTIPEGRRLTQILDELAQQTRIPKADFVAALKQTAAIGLPAEAGGQVEGYLFPATYTFEPSDKAVDILAAMIEREQQVMSQLGVAAGGQRSLLIEASLVQAEAGKVADMPKIARVLDNRMAKHMNLELDTTVHYATGRFTLTTTNADLRFPSPYNTYLHAGLPPGPICSPGLAALQAVLSPTPGPWLWFTTVNPTTGETDFASTPAEKAAMDAKWQAWQKAHPGQ